MPHLMVYASEDDLTGRESDVIAALTDAVADVYGEWARGVAVVQMIGLPAGRWGVGGTAVTCPAPRVVFGIKAAVFARPDAEDIVARLVAGVTEALVSVFGERIRTGVEVDLVGTPAGRGGVGGLVITG